MGDRLGRNHEYCLKLTKEQTLEYYTGNSQEKDRKYNGAIWAALRR